VPAEDGVTRSAVPEKEILQRELKGDSPGWLWTASNLVVLFCTLALIAAISWGVGRYSRRGSVREPYPDAPADTPEESSRLTSGQA
jgi:hypothetical protein